MIWKTNYGLLAILLIIGSLIIPQYLAPLIVPDIMDPRRDVVGGEMMWGSLAVSGIVLWLIVRSLPSEKAGWVWFIPTRFLAYTMIVIGIGFFVAALRRH